jgi:hypothetical protein
VGADQAGWAAALIGASFRTAFTISAAPRAILLAALHYLTLRGATMGGFSGLPLKTEADWKRAQAAFSGLLARTYQSSAKAS